MPVEFICHIGFVKAASTFLQLVLRDIAAEVLLPRGVLPWIPNGAASCGFIVPEILQALRRYYEAEGMLGFEYRKALRPELEKYPVNPYALAEYLALFGDESTLRALRQRLAESLADPAIRKVLFSHEDLVCGGLRHCRRSEELVERRDQTLTRFRFLLGDMESRCVVVLRRQDQLLMSWYHTFVAYHLVTAPFEEIASFLAPLFHYDQLIERLRQWFGPDRVDILFFEDLRVDAFAFTDRFLQLAVPDVALDRSSNLVAQNASLSPDALRIMLAANVELRRKHRIEPALIPWRVAAKCDREREALQMTLMGFQREPGDRYEHETPEMTRQLLEPYIAGNQRLFDDLLGPDHPGQRWRATYVGVSN